MNIIYQTHFTKIGQFAHDALSENMLIIFKQNVPADLEDYCFLHSHGKLQQDLQVGDIVQFNQTDYEITAVGEVCSYNLKELGHVTFRFDGSTIAEYPGTLHLKGNIPTNLEINSQLIIKQKGRHHHEN